MICALMITLGLAYIWQAVPASEITGIAPPEGMDTEEGWYAFNEITGWALLFCGLTTGIFLFAISSKIKKASSFALLAIAALAVSIILASVAAELLTIILVK